MFKTKKNIKKDSNDGCGQKRTNHFMTHLSVKVRNRPSTLHRTERRLSKNLHLRFFVLFRAKKSPGGPGQER